MLPAERHLKPLSAVDHGNGAQLYATAQSDRPAVRIAFGDLTELSARLSVAKAAPNARDHFLPLVDFVREQRRQRRAVAVLSVGALSQAERIKELLADAKVDVRIDKPSFSLARLAAQHRRRSAVEA